MLHVNNQNISAKVIKKNKGHCFNFLLVVFKQILSKFRGRLAFNSLIQIKVYFLVFDLVKPDKILRFKTHFFY